MYVYVMYNDKNEVLYVGKTINIESRMRQHFGKDAEEWKMEVKNIKYMNCFTEIDMSIYEIYLINVLKPKYNKALLFSGDTNLNLHYNLIDYNIKTGDFVLLSTEEKRKFKNLITIVDDEKYNTNFYNRKKSKSKIEAVLSNKWRLDKNNKDKVLKLFYNTTNIYKNKSKTKYFKNAKLAWIYYEYPEFINKINTFKRIANFSLHKNSLDEEVQILAYLRNDFRLNKDRQLDDILSLESLIRLLKNTAIKNDKPILLYLPSPRMRRLFIKYLNNELGGQYEETSKN